MNENLGQTQMSNPTIQPRAAAPGAPGGTTTPPIYLQEYPAETSNDTTTYDNKNAIWDSGTQSNGYKTVSFAGNDRGIQLRASTIDYNPTAPPGAPGRNLSTKIYARVKKAPQAGYLPWQEIYHTGNFNTSIYATKTQLNLKADKTYVDDRLSSLSIPDVNGKADKTYVDNALSNKADKSYVDNKVSNISSSVVCTGFVNHSAVSCTGGGATCAVWGNGSYTVNLSQIISGVTITPIASNSANISCSVHNVGGMAFSVNITKNGQGFDCPFYFQAFNY